MDPNTHVFLVCLFNAFLLLILLAALPLGWALRKALIATAKTLDGWSEATHAGLGSAPASLLKLRDSLRQTRTQLSQAQRWTGWIQGLLTLGRWLLRS